MNTLSERLKSARKMKGLSLQALADTLGNRVSRQALHKYEKGLSTPDSTLINAICYVLNIRPDYLYREQLIELGPIAYRKLPELSAVEQQVALESSRDLLERYLELETLLGVNSDFENPMIEEEMSDWKSVEYAAEELRKKWQLGTDAISNVFELLESKEIKVLEIEAHDAFNGMSTFASEKIPIIVVNKNHVVDRRRFTALHELAHLILKFSDNIDTKTQEKLCNTFAGAMLLPATSLRYELGENRHELHMKELVQIKEKYGISIQAVLMRAKMHGIISDYYTKQFFDKLRVLDSLKNEPGTYHGIEKTSRFNQLLLRGLSEDAFSLSKAAVLANTTVSQFREFLKIDKSIDQTIIETVTHEDSNH